MDRKVSFFIILICLSIFPSNVRAQIDPKGIDIIRDKWGVPHIYAATDPEVAYGLAWAHAEDDFASIQVMVAVAKSRLGEYMGKDGAAADYLMGLLRCEEVVERHFADLSPNFIDVLDGYVAGLNAYATQFPKEVALRKLFPISTRELLRGYVLNLSLFSGVGRVVPSLIEGEIEPLFDVQGSNAFAVAREKTEDNNVFLAINSHQPLEGPLAWYEAHLVSEEGWNTLGGLFPGGVTVFHGVNEQLGWAHTVNYPDKIDIFQLETDPENTDRYQVDGAWFELEERKVRLKVKLFAGLKLGIKKKVYWSKFGPAIKNDKGVFAFDMGALHDIRAPEQWYRMNKARNFDEFYEAMSMVGIPGFNTVYADREGNIFYIGNAKIPFREPGFDWKSVVPGNSMAIYADQYHPITDLPQVLNPACHYVFNTNHSAFISTGIQDHLDQSNYDETMGYMLWNNNRSTRLLELLAGEEKISWDEFLEMKYDSRLPDSLAYLIDINPLFQINPEVIVRGKDVLKVLQKWNRKADIDEVGPAHFVVFYDHLRKKLNAPLDTITRPRPEEMIESLAFTSDYFLKNFGKLDVTLGEYQQLVRGKKEKPVMGIPDVITAMHSVPYKDGRVKAYAGECYILMVRFPEEGLPLLESVNVYGASNKPESPHYDDQMEMFLKQQRKKMTLNIDEVRRNASKIYHPK